MARVVLDHVYKYYGQVLAVDDVSISIEDGEFIVLLGPSGCGKTTSLRMIAGLEEISQGEIRIGKTVVNQIHPRDRDVAMVFQSYALYPHMTVRNNLSYGLKRRRMPASEIAARVEQVAAMLQIDKLLERKPAELSGGQRQRVALGRAIVRRPEVFLMDEPLSNLDAKLRVQMREELIQLHRQLGVTTVYVTHDQVEAMTMGDRIVVMNHGKVQQIGPPLELYRQPYNLFVASFLGSPQMNQITGRLQHREGALAFHAGEVRFDLGSVQSGAITSVLDKLSGDEIILGIRPEHFLTRSEEKQETGLELGVGRVDHIEHLGRESFAGVDCNGTRLLVEISTDSSWRPDDEIRLRVDPADLMFFDPRTELRLRAS